MLPPSPSDEDLILAVTPVVERVIRKRFFGARADSGTYESERARDCVQQALLELVMKFDRVASAVDPPIQSPENYAARVAHNVVNDVVRPPNWTRLKHRVFRVISRTPSFATWQDSEFGKVCGYAGWRTQQQLTAPASMATLRQGASDLRADAVLATHWDNMGMATWQTLLERVFDIAGGPIAATTLVNFLAELLDIGWEVPLTDLLPADE